MGNQADILTINIDNRAISVRRGATILEAAQENDIYIPTLCAHKDLTPFGGCRMCIVEIENMRGFPTSCTTPVEAGMVIRTQTAQLQSMRAEILRLILSEHPSSCLICDESAECREFMGTIRKVGVTTGCRWCPNDGQCELQKVVEWMGITEIGYPIYYRNLPIEKDDPFYDRDYNLCILCGRCIRVCQEVRAANTLAFKMRGRNTVVGPAYSRTHLEAGCEFCGACVELCPTGSLSEKTRKWSGQAEREVATTCPLCGVGCQLNLQIKGNEVIGALPAEDELVNHRQLCVKGRFCLPELVNHTKRLKHPYQVQDGTRVRIPLNEAISQAATRLSICAPGKFGLLISPSLANEDLYIAQKFTRTVMNSNNIDCSARAFYGPSFNAYLKLLRKSRPLTSLREASVIFCIGLDTRFGRSVVGVELRRAVKRGAKIITFNPYRHNLSLLADIWLKPNPGSELEFLSSILNLLKSGANPKALGGDDLVQAFRMLREAADIAILTGSEFLNHSDGPEIFEAIADLAQALGAGILPLPAQNNLVGSILMGVYPEFMPGGLVSAGNSAQITKFSRTWGRLQPDLPAADLSEKLEVLYLVGETPLSARPFCDFLITQNIYAPEPFDYADLVFPAAAFSESDGSFINGEGRIQRVRRAVNPPGDCLPDWEILCRIARVMGVKGFDFENAAEIHREISTLIPGFLDFDNPGRSANPLVSQGVFNISRGPEMAAKKDNQNFPLLLVNLPAENTHRGFPLSARVAGINAILPEGRLIISPGDARKAGLSEGDLAIVNSSAFEKVWPVKINNRLSEGILQITLPPGEFPGPNPYPVSIRRKDV